jgi:hypothetical protein
MIPLIVMGIITLVIYSYVLFVFWKKINRNSFLLLQILENKIKIPIDKSERIEIDDSLGQV